MFSRIVLVVLLVSPSRGLEWCKVFQANHMRFTEIENKQQPYYNYLVSQNYNFSALDQVYYKFALYNGRAIYTTPLPVIVSGTIPYTAAELVPNWSKTNPLSKAFPSWQWNRNPPAGIFSTSDVQVDKCGRAWIMDHGRKTAAEIEPLYNPKILIWSLVENKMLMAYKIPKAQYGPGKSVILHLEIDTSRGCDLAYAISSDSGQNALVIVKYNQPAQKITSWRVKDESFMPQAQFANTTYRNIVIPFNFGVYSITIVPSFRKGQPGHLYYSSLSGNTWYKVPLYILYSEELWTRGYAKIDTSTGNVERAIFQNVFKKGQSGGNEDNITYIPASSYFVKLGQVGYATSARCNYDPVDYGFYCPAPDLHAITYWDVRKPFNLDNVIFRDPALLDFPTQILINKGRGGRQEIYVVSDSLLKFLTNLEDVNFNYNFYLYWDVNWIRCMAKKSSSPQCLADYCKGF